MTTKIVQLQDLQPGMKLVGGHTVKTVSPRRNGRTGLLTVTDDKGHKISTEYTADTMFEALV